ncbi:hypothetical protein [Lysobacter arvi]|uniref:Uncharacterized protein n=1 Tax=Lysobacter arvi TaxID=3038776 RepID=A0ABU1CDJ7_9GAMM|nr:hypothetical protein [Lysobacter arvi]MDR0183252.1 hypothetical protein [Lysobacter arvi]
MQHQKKKARERFMLERFLEAIELPADIIEDDREAPDFVIKHAARAIGVEVTELYIQDGANPSSMQANERAAREIVFAAWAQFRAASDRPLLVRVTFRDQLPRNLNRADVARQIAGLVLEMSPVVWQSASWPSPDADWVPLMEAVIGIRVTGVPTEALWSPSGSGWVADANAKVLQARVDAKAPRLPRYRSQVDEVWLLIVADGSTPSQFFDPPTAEQARSVTSPFDQTWFFGRSRRRAVRLADCGVAEPAEDPAPPTEAR